MISHNEVIISGKCNWFRYFDPNGKPYTSMWIRVDLQNKQSLLIDIPIGEKEINGKVLNFVKSKLEAGNCWIVASGMIINKKGQGGKNTTMLRSSLRNLEVLSQESTEINRAIISGDIESQDHRKMIVGFSYRNPLDNTWKKRNIPVLLPEAGQPEFDQLHRNALENVKLAKRVLVIGKVYPKLPTGAELVHVLAETIIPIL